nr:hypothetical protein KPHV_07430 [Kitasatospora purpeofusca]
MRRRGKADSGESGSGHRAAGRGARVRPPLLPPPLPSHPDATAGATGRAGPGPGTEGCQSWTQNSMDRGGTVRVRVVPDLAPTPAMLVEGP